MRIIQTIKGTFNFIFQFLTMSIVDKDSRDTQRGCCMEHPDCREYEWIPEVGFQCSYCGCLPVQHIRIESTSIAVEDPQLDFPNEKDALPSQTSECNGQDPDNLPSLSNASTTQQQHHTCALCEQSVTLEYLILDQFRSHLL